MVCLQACILSTLYIWRVFSITHETLLAICGYMYVVFSARLHVLVTRALLQYWETKGVLVGSFTFSTPINTVWLHHCYHSCSAVL